MTLLAERDALLDEDWRLDPSVALRPEPFGALAYHFGTRRLSFLKTPELVDVVRRLADGTVGEALTAAGVPEAHWPAYARALRSLADGGMITRRGART
ncbi:MAG: mycofactocin biosynthesis chaperone MftB [Nocardioidaceae bacterium]|nr:mycofactocin biosynthesis chaperone MftB [Nocardioidaceae bacterium]NUS50610.1 mycofactocin biosynthesis chaperone MftB [Nocardioidaceae bacterium]